MKKISYILLLIIPLVLFIDWIIMVITGHLASAFNAGEGFYCKPYCIFGIILLVTTLTVSVYLAIQQRKV